MPRVSASSASVLVGPRKDPRQDTSTLTRVGLTSSVLGSVSVSRPSLKVADASSGLHVGRIEKPHRRDNATEPSGLVQSPRPLR